MTTDIKGKAYLFVYGSLLSKTNNPMATLLQKYSISKEEGSFRGKLYDAGSYPAAISSNSQEDTVFGELYTLKDADMIFKNLDEYEGFYAQRPQDSLFIRKKVTVRNLENGSTKTAWVYLYNRSVDNLTHIPGGDYLEYLQSEKNQN